MQLSSIGHEIFTIELLEVIKLFQVSRHLKPRANCKVHVLKYYAKHKVDKHLIRSMHSREGKELCMQREDPTIASPQILCHKLDVCKAIVYMGTCTIHITRLSTSNQNLKIVSLTILPFQ